MRDRSIITPAIKRFQKDAPSKVPDCAEEEEGDAVASATDDDKAAGALIKQISEMFSCRRNNSSAFRAGSIRSGRRYGTIRMESGCRRERNCVERNADLIYNSPADKQLAGILKISPC